MENVKETYSAFHVLKRSVHVYPTEWVIRTLLGNYPKLSLDKPSFTNSKLLDLGFGDCRNMPLLKNCGFEIHGVEISKEIVLFGRAKLLELNILADLREGTNTHIPYKDDFFDYILACHSIYYVDRNSSFDDNLLEISRVLKKDGILIASLPAPDNFILKNCINLGNGHVEITNDIYGLRNGYIFRTFENEEEIKDVFSNLFKNVVICKCLDNFWGVQINFFIIVCEKE